LVVICEDNRRDPEVLGDDLLYGTDAIAKFLKRKPRWVCRRARPRARRSVVETACRDRYQVSDLRSVGCFGKYRAGDCDHGDSLGPAVSPFGAEPTPGFRSLFDGWSTVIENRLRAVLAKLDDEAA